MDPVSAAGLIGSVIGITDVVARSIHKLSVLGTRYRQANSWVSALLGQLCTIKAALAQLTDLSRSEGADILRSSVEIKNALESSLDGCSILVESLEEQLDRLSTQDDGCLDARGKLSFLWRDEEVKNYLDLLDRQVNALNLLLQVVQCKSRAEQRALMREDDSITAIRLARECTESLYVLNDTTSHRQRASIISEKSERLSVRFAFDQSLLGSRVYQIATTSNVKSLIRQERAQRTEHFRSIEQTEEFGQVEQIDDDKKGDEHEDGAVDKETDEGEESDQTNQAKRVEYNDDPKRSPVGQERAMPSDRTYQRAPPHSRELDADSVFVERDTTVQGERIDSMQGEHTKTSSKRFPIATTPTNWRHSRLRNRNTKRLPEPPTYAAVEQGQEAPVESKTDRKIVVFGPHASGKSTLIESMKLRFGEPVPGYGRQEYKESIHSSVIHGMRAMLEAMEKLEVSLGDPNNADHVAPLFGYESTNLTPDVSSAIKHLWADSGVKSIYRRRREYQLQDDCSYYCEAIDRLAEENYVPTDEDIMRSSVETTGITETIFTRPGTAWRFFDTGGDSERRTWAQCFPQTNCVIFTVDITCFNEVVLEDPWTNLMEDPWTDPEENRGNNRMQQALTLSDSLINSWWFVRTPFVLLFTKCNKIAQLLHRESVKDYFLEFEGENTEEDYIPYVTKQFTSLKKNKAAVLEIRYVDIDYGLTNPAKVAQEACTTAMQKQDELCLAEGP